MVVRNGYIKRRMAALCECIKKTVKRFVLRGDHTHVYWLCADLYDSGIVVMDSHEDYYFVDSSLKSKRNRSYC